MITSEGIKATVRPIVTYTFVLAIVLLALLWAIKSNNPEAAFAGLAPFVMLVLRDYFDARKEEEKLKAEKEPPVMASVPVEAIVPTADSSGIK